MKLMTPPSFAKRVVSGLFIFLLLVFGFSNFLIHKLVPKSDECLFLENVMIRYGGLYVLMGSKPLIDFPIDSYFPQSGNSRNPTRLWENWERIRKEYVGPYYRFGVVKLDSRRLGFFINIPTTIWTLKAHYQDFMEINGGPFDPERVVEEFGQENSSFWNQVFQSSYGNGLLLGYGTRNAFLFDYKSQEKILLPRFADIEGSFEIHTKENIKVSDLPLPGFCVFCLGDEIMENYKCQRSQIIEEFRGKDFESTVKQWLAFGWEEEAEMREIR